MPTTKRTVRIELSDEDMKQAVTAWAKAQRLIHEGADDVTVTVNVRERRIGYGMSERLEHYGEVVLVSNE